MIKPKAVLLALLFACLLSNTSAAASASYVPLLLNVFTSPQQLIVNAAANLSVSFYNISTKQPIQAEDFLVSHAVVLHMVAVGSDLDTFAHWHPAQVGPGARFTFGNKVFPKSGTYLVQINGVVPEGQVVKATQLKVVGSPAMTSAADAYSPRLGTTEVYITSVPLQTESQPADSLSSLIVQQPRAQNTSANATTAVYRVTLSGPQSQECIPGQPMNYTWNISAASTSAPVTDLKPYYAAPMHLAIVSSDLTYIAHEHGDAADNNIVNSSNSTSSTTVNNSHGDEGQTGHGRRLLKATTTQRVLKQAAASSAAGSMAPMGTAANGMGHNHASQNASYGPVIRTDGIVLPRAGIYLMVGQVARGSELLLLPFYITCNGTTG